MNILCVSQGKALTSAKQSDNGHLFTHSWLKEETEEAPSYTAIKFTIK